MAEQTLSLRRGTEVLFARVIEFLIGFKNSTYKTPVIKSLKIASVSGLTKKWKIWKPGQGDIHQFPSVGKANGNLGKAGGAARWETATPLWETTWGPGFLWGFFGSNAFYQLSRKSNPVFKMTLLELTCRKDKQQSKA